MADTLTNNPPIGIELFQERLDAFVSEATAIKSVTAENAAKVRDCIGSGVSLAKEIEAQRKTDKQPHLDATRAVDAAYKPASEAVTNAVKPLKALLQAYLAEQERIAKAKAEAEARALREAEEAARKAEESKRAAEVEEDPFLAATAEAVEEAPATDLTAAAERARLADMEAKAASRVGSAAGGFNTTGLKTKRVAVVTNAAALAAHYVGNGNSDMLALLERLAQAEVRHAKGGPVNLPGVQVKEERVL